MQRPVFVTIIAWVSIAFGIFFLLAYGLAAYLFLASPVEPSAGELNPTSFLGWSMAPAVYWTLVLVIPFFLVVDGVFLLKGHNWARLAAVVWWTFALLSLVYTYGMSLLAGIQALICVLVIFFLNTRSAVAFFRREERAGE